MWWCTPLVPADLCGFRVYPVYNEFQASQGYSESLIIRGKKAKVDKTDNNKASEGQHIDN